MSDDYIKRVDAIEKINNALKRVFVEDMGQEILASIPSADVVPVVRCKDCKMSEVFQNDSSGVMARYCNAFRLIRMVADDDYCSYGERKDDETDRC